MRFQVLEASSARLRLSPQRPLLSELFQEVLDTSAPLSRQLEPPRGVFFFSFGPGEFCPLVFFYFRLFAVFMGQMQFINFQRHIAMIDAEIH